MMKKIFFVLLFIFVCTRSFAQFPILSDIYDDYEFSITPAYQTNGENIFYNNGTDVEVEISERIKIKFPNNSGCNFCYGPNVTFPIFFEDINGNRHLVGEFLHNYFANYSIEAGKIYSKYYLTKIKFKPEIMALGKGKIYFGVYEKDDPTYKTAATAHILKTRVDISFIQVPKFIGPSQVCSEANYTIERPGTITLENAAGIATLTSLGNNQWKVSRIGGANGKVLLRSTSNGKTFDKEITLGSPTSTDIFIDGLQGNLEPNTTYYFQLKPGFSIDSYNWSVIGGTIISGKNSNTVEVRTDPNPYNSLNNFQISLNYIGACGTGTLYHARYVNKGGGDPIDPGE